MAPASSGVAEYNPTKAVARLDYGASRRKGAGVGGAVLAGLRRLGARAAGAARGRVRNRSRAADGGIGLAQSRNGQGGKSVPVDWTQTGIRLAGAPFPRSSL